MGCEVCDGLGYVALDVPVGDVRFGRLVLCPACGEAVLKARAAARMAGQRDRLRRFDGRNFAQSFGSFVVEGVSPQVVEAFYVACDYARSPSGWLVFSGTVGTGKTHLLMAILNAQPAEVQCLFVTTPNLLDLLRSGYKRGDYEALLRTCCEVPLLALDDLGVENGTDWAAEKLFQIVNERYQARRPLVVSTNVPVRELDPRLASRLSDDDLVTTVALYAPDFRQRRSAPGRVVEWKG